MDCQYSEIVWTSSTIRVYSADRVFSSRRVYSANKAISAFTDMRVFIKACH